MPELPYTIQHNISSKVYLITPYTCIQAILLIKLLHLRNFKPCLVEAKLLADNFNIVIIELHRDRDKMKFVDRYLHITIHSSVSRKTYERIVDQTIFIRNNKHNV